MRKPIFMIAVAFSAFMCVGANAESFTTEEVSDFLTKVVSVANEQDNYSQDMTAYVSMTATDFASNMEFPIEMSLEGQSMFFRDRLEWNFVKSTMSYMGTEEVQTSEEYKITETDGSIVVLSNEGDGWSQEVLAAGSQDGIMTTFSGIDPSLVTLTYDEDSSNYYVMFDTTQVSGISMPTGEESASELPMNVIAVFDSETYLPSIITVKTIDPYVETTDESKITVSTMVMNVTFGDYNTCVMPKIPEETGYIATETETALPPETEEEPAETEKPHASIVPVGGHTEPETDASQDGGEDGIKVDLPEGEIYSSAWDKTVRVTAFDKIDRFAVIDREDFKGISGYATDAQMEYPNFSIALYDDAEFHGEDPVEFLERTWNDDKEITKTMEGYDNVQFSDLMQFVDAEYPTYFYKESHENVSEGYGVTNYTVVMGIDNAGYLYITCSAIENGKANASTYLTDDFVEELVVNHISVNKEI